MTGAAMLRAGVAAANLALLVLFPWSWFQPVIRSGLVPILGLTEMSVVSGLQALWRSDPVLALIVTAFAVFAPMLKTLGLALLHAGLLDRRTLPALHVLGKLAMADVFLIALGIVVVRGAGYVTVEVAWGLYAFAACVVASLAVSLATGWLWR
jgi:uncharacterized paraquat-inducible protein A